MQDITADVTVEDPKGKLNYLKVQAEESAAAETETATAETQEITEEQTRCYRRDRNTGTVRLAGEQNIDNRQVPVSLRKQKRQVLLD